MHCMLAHSLILGCNWYCRVIQQLKDEQLLFRYLKSIMTTRLDVNVVKMGSGAGTIRSFKADSTVLSPSCVCVCVCVCVYVLTGRS